MDTKVLALYLPQFHQIPENDEWWGEGFTEWNVVKKAKKICKYSNQPRVPLNGDYYDLSKVENIEKQAKLAKSYNVDGFVIYSYYSNGKLLLEKPAQLLLGNKSINIEYCFSWANHDWRRNWFQYNKELLRAQEYASCDEQILEHFNYLLPYFKDERYIKINNKPVLFIYNYASIPNIERYIEVWNKAAVNNGFSGMFFVQTLGAQTLEWKKDLFEACFDFEPSYTSLNMHFACGINSIKRRWSKIYRPKSVINSFNYKKVCRRMLKRVYNDPYHCYGIFTEWDNTPRHEINGTVYKKFSLKEFEKQVKGQLQKAKNSGCPFVVIDAWNEWGEGAFLEPDESLGYGKLEILKKYNAK